MFDALLPAAFRGTGPKKFLMQGQHFEKMLTQVEA